MMMSWTAQAGEGPINSWLSLRRSALSVTMTHNPNMQSGLEAGKAISSRKTSRWRGEVVTVFPTIAQIITKEDAGGRWQLYRPRHRAGGGGGWGEGP